MAGPLIFSDSEFEVKTYHCTQLVFPPCAGYLTVTNKRVIFHGFSSSYSNNWLGRMVSQFTNSNSTSSRITKEVKIDSVSGVSAFYGAKINSFRLVIGILLLLIALVLFSNAQTTNWYTGRSQVSGFRIVLGLLSMGLGIYGLIKCLRRIFYLKILSSQSSGAITIGEGIGGILGGTAAFSLAAQPTAETDQMILELGALINDIQALGDRGAIKWNPGSSLSDN